MKILLLNPPMYYGAYNEAGRLYLDKSYPPLGLGYIAAVLEQGGYEVKVLDLIDTPFEKIPNLLKRENPDIVGISCNLTDYRWGSLRLAQISKSVCPKAWVVLGGFHATQLYHQILENYTADVVIRFEGELAFLEFVEAVANSSDLNRIQGIAFKKGEKIIKTSDRPPITDLNSLPTPAYHFFDFDKYARYSSPAKFRGKNVRELKSRSIMASRGCPHDCEYCSVAKFWHRHCRFRSAKNVVNEMETLVHEQGVAHFNFFDDAFTLNPKWVVEICQEIIKRKLEISWECVTRVDCVTEELLQWMKKAGCLSVSYGVESGSPTVLKAINKKQTPAQVAHAFKITHEAGLKAYILLMVGNPHESDSSINETIMLLRAIKPDKIRTNLTLVYPATGLYQRCVKAGLLNDDYWLSEKAAPVYTLENSVKQLKKWENKIIFSYYLQNRQVLRLFEVIFYRLLFKNFREMIRCLAPQSDVYLDKIDHMLHQA